MNKRLYFILFYFISIFIFSTCASISAPSGGPKDLSSPILLNDKIYPKSTLNIDPYQKIILPFNERIYPSTSISAISIEPETKISIKIRNNSIEIRPEEEWPTQFKVFINRTLTDYNKNSLQNPIQISFSRLDSITFNDIKGSLFNFDTLNYYHIYLLNENLSVISKTESNLNGKFNFLIQDDNYSNNVILAIEKQSSDNFNEEIRFKNYGLSSQLINPYNNPIYISEPLRLSKINNITLINKNYGEIILTNGEKYFLILNDLYLKKFCFDKDNYIFKNHDFKDSIEIDLKLSNQVENYNVSNSFMLSETVIDTLPPSIINKTNINNSILLQFSEPIYIDSLYNPFYLINEDSLKINLNYDYKNPSLVSLKQLANNSFYIDCDKIKDLNNNNLCEDTILIEIEDDHNTLKNQDFGKLSGIIDYDGEYDLVVEAINLGNKKTYTDLVSNNNFVFSKLEPGYYKVWVYENINLVSQSYFSGTLDPLKKAAKFTEYEKNIYIRSNWSNSISITFK